MKTDPVEVLNVYDWRTNRQGVLEYIAGRIDIMLNDRGTGVFEINLEEMYKEARAKFRAGWHGVAERVEAKERESIADESVREFQASSDGE